VEQISREQFNAWKNLPVTQQFFLELAEMYYDNVTREPVVIAHAQVAAQNSAGEPILFAHTNPVEETAINSALKAGRVQVMEALMEYQPSNLEEEKANDD
jgi:hypothetical protein